MSRSIRENLIIIKANKIVKQTRKGLIHILFKYLQFKKVNINEKIGKRKKRTISQSVID